LLGGAKLLPTETPPLLFTIILVEPFTCAWKGLEDPLTMSLDDPRLVVPIPKLPLTSMRILSEPWVTNRKGLVLVEVVPSPEVEVEVLFSVRFQDCAVAGCKLQRVSTATTATTRVNFFFILEEFNSLRKCLYCLLFSEGFRHSPV
jgi:hypothetical protein